MSNQFLKNSLNTPTKKHHVIIVDNDADYLNTLNNKLKMNNFSVSVTPSIIDTIQIIESESMPDLVIIAISESDPLDIRKLKQFREKFSQNILPIIVFASRRHLTKDIVSMFQLGINDYVSRPVVVQELLARIAMHIQLSQENKRSREIAIKEYIAKRQTDDKINQLKEKYQDRKIKVLLVDDQFVSGKKISDMLASENDIDFYFCQDERKAIKKAETLLPHVILQDINMPYINGLTLVCMYKKNKRLASIPVIILSARNDISSKSCSFSAGACDFIVKPPNENILRDRIRYHAVKGTKADIQKNVPHHNDLTISSNRQEKIDIDRYRQTKERKGSTIKVLLVDDQAFIGKVVGLYLKNEKDIDFYFCQDPTKAIGIALEIVPTVIIQDLTMPKIDGLTMVKAYREQNTLKRTPLVVLSSEENAKIKADAFTSGANDYLVKPPDKIELIARIRYHSKAYNNILQLDDAYKEVNKQRTELEIRNNFIKKTFGRYLSDNIVSSILDTPEGLELGGEKRKVTIMMSDLRGFTTIAENLKPEEVLSILNIYLEIMTEIILKYDGTIDEFIGDAILVMFGAPLSNDDDAIRAVACALEMQVSMEEVNKKNQLLGYPELQMGIGINTGEVIVGNIGSDMRSKYGIVGSHVNLTSRIESYTVGNQILISETTLNECGSRLKVKNIMSVMPKGVKVPINIYHITGISGEYAIDLPAQTPVELKALTRPKDIKISVLEGKDIDRKAHTGKIIRHSDKIMDIQTNILLKHLSNIKMSLCSYSGDILDGDIYAKIIECHENTQYDLSTYRIHLTSVDQEAENALNACVE